VAYPDGVRPPVSVDSHLGCSQARLHGLLRVGPGIGIPRGLVQRHCKVGADLRLEVRDLVGGELRVPVLQHLVSSRVRHECPVEADEVVKPLLEGVGAVPLVEDVGVRHQHLEPHRLELGQRDVAPDGVDHGRKAGGLDALSSHLHHPDPAHQVGLSDLEGERMGQGGRDRGAMVHISGFRAALRCADRGPDVFKARSVPSHRRRPGTGMLDFKSQVLVALSILVGLFFIEYPPLFLLGYWTWGAAVHKTLTGAFLITNLLVAQFVARRLGSFRGGRRPGRSGVQKGLPGT
jgi:hypothetical protein